MIGPSNKKPPLWNISPYLTAAPKMWRRANLVVPVFASRGGDGSKSIFFSGEAAAVKEATVEALGRGTVFSAGPVGGLLDTSGNSDNSVDAAGGLAIPVVDLDPISTDGITLLWFGRNLFAPTGEFFASRFANAANDYDYGMYGAGTSLLTLFYGTAQAVTSTLTIAAQENRIAIAADAAGVDFYLNSQTNTKAGVTLAIENAPFLLGGRDEGGSAGFGIRAHHYFFAQINRKLSAAEIRDWQRDPFAMIRMSDSLTNPALWAAPAPPTGAIMNQFQGPNMGADLYNGALL